MILHLNYRSRQQSMSKTSPLSEMMCRNRLTELTSVFRQASSYRTAQHAVVNPDLFTPYTDQALLYR
jgi:hypothetical protein